jgi:hypothetical protein
MKGLRADDQVIDNIYLAVRKQHQIEHRCTFEVALDLVSHVVILMVSLHHFLNDVRRVVQLHQLRNVYHLVVPELQNEMLSQIFLQRRLVFVGLEANCEVDNETSRHRPSIIIDTYHLLNVCPREHWHKDDIGGLHRVKHRIFQNAVGLNLLGFNLSGLPHILLVRLLPSLTRLLLFLVNLFFGLFVVQRFQVPRISSLSGVQLYLCHFDDSL